MSEQEIITLLDSLGVTYERFTHPAVFTCEEAIEKCPPMPGHKSKNLFLRDKKGKNYALVLTTYEKQVNLEELSGTIGLHKLGFASPERLKSVLNVEPGSVGLLSLVNDSNNATQVFIDEELLSSSHLSSHPGINTSTLCLKVGDLPKFFEHTGHTWSRINM